MRPLILTCCCGSTDFDYTATDTFECTDCGKLSIVEISGPALLLVPTSE